MRLHITGGRVDADKLVAISEISARYGNGYIHLTSRQSIEIPFIKLDDIQIVRQELEKADIQTGACGPRVRTITACQGNTVCPNGFIDSASLARALDEKYYGRELPHKFKIGIAGCRNNCLKAEENDIGIKGGMFPVWMSGRCSFCGLCEDNCRESSIKLDKKSGTLAIDGNTCVFCGRCAASCPENGAMEGRKGYIVYFGGMFGNKIRIGKRLAIMVFSIDVLYGIIDAAMDFFEKNGAKGERFCLTLDRVGLEKLMKELDAAIGRPHFKIL